MGRRTQCSVRFRAIQREGWTPVWMQEQHDPVSASMSIRPKADNLLSSYTILRLGAVMGAVMEQVFGAHALMPLHTNVQPETGRSRDPDSPSIFHKTYI